MHDERLHWYQGFTLVDITDTGITKFVQEQAKQRNQHRNWESILQVLGLRTQILDIKQEIILDHVSKYEFGNAYNGQQNIWIFKFCVEFEKIYEVGNNPVEVLEKDFEQTPVIVGLDETAKFPMSLLYTYGKEKNIYFKLLLEEVNNSVVDA